MFLDFYRFREQPFGVTPDPRYLYLSPSHREALASLLYGMETERGFLSLVAEPGLGKTTLLFQLLIRLKAYVHSAFLFQTQCDSRELLHYLLDDLGLDCHDRDIVRMHAELNNFLYRETSAGKQVVVFIDEAQNLSDTALETVRLLSDFESPGKKLLQIILAGQPGLAHRLSHPELTQLRQRISVQARLDPLTPLEVVGYIQHRLQVAGYTGTGLFTPGAFTEIGQRSRGIPRLINNLCFNALSIGCATGSDRITAEMVQEAASDLSLDLQVARRPQSSRPPPEARRPPALLSKYRSIWSKIRSNLLGQRYFQAFALSLVLSSLAVYIGFGTLRRTNHSISTIQEGSSRASAPQGAGLISQSATPGAAELNQPRFPTDRGSSNKSFTYVVQPKDTLRELCVSVVGRYDKTVVAEIMKLNPGIRNLNHLEVGQEIRFPLSDSR